MRPTNRTCPTCEEKIKRLRNVPEFAGRLYCSSDCTIAAWEAAQAKAARRMFGEGTSE